MSLPLVDTFFPAYEKWETRHPTLEEMLASDNPHRSIRVRLEATVANAHEAATYIGRVGADNGLGNVINGALDNSVAFKHWRQAMPSKTPDELSRYQKSYPYCDFAQVSAEIEAIGQVLSEGQCLFHAGLWPGDDRLTTDRPLSTSFCPQVALRNADHLGKGYDAGRIDLFVLRATSPRTNVFAYKRKGTNLGHENEVVFASGANLKLVSTGLVSTNYPAGKYGFPNKRISVRVLAVDIS
ncbi:hypothetical protein [Stenotrophomonas pigmentata]|uniref:hypothetical protein n=1 Tax=Stenotrophomonas pigmentata TaxID=3055080 RepID=UPI0026F2CE3C|nr:hypothetical protein [Stenotrophomonas sp. 610A2]